MMKGEQQDDGGDFAFRLSLPRFLLTGVTATAIRAGAVSNQSTRTAALS